MIKKELYRKLTDIVPLDKIESHAKLSSAGFMDLGVDILHSEGDNTFIALSHYYKAGGDMIPDPDMEIKVNHTSKEAEALTFQDAYGYQTVFQKSEQPDAAIQASLNQFLSHWLTNLKNQGHRLEGDNQSLHR